jgi:hypothetical protein
LTVAQGTLTDPVTGLSLSATWNDAADTFRGLDIQITNTASNAASTPFRILGGASGTSSVFSVRADGALLISGIAGSSCLIQGESPNSFSLSFNGGKRGFFGTSTGGFVGFQLYEDDGIGWTSTLAGGGAGDLKMGRASAGVLYVSGNATGAALQLLEMTAPAAPAAASNQVRIYAEDNGAGKTRIMALFQSGAAQQIAIEP